MTKRRGRTAYTEEFRREAVRLVAREPGQLAQVARGLDVNAETLRAWWHRYQQYQQDQTGPLVPTAAAPRVLTLEEENRRLRQENARLTEERDILKKATAFFARDAR